MTPQDPVAALRAVLAANAKIPHLEAQIAHLMKRNASAELEAIRAALAESPLPNAPADCDLAGWVRYLVRAWETEREEARNLADLCQGAHTALDVAGAPDDATPAERIQALVSSHREMVRALSGERPDYLTPGASELACPQCGCVVYWQIHEVHDGAEGSAHCSRSSYTARAPSMPLIGDGACDWRGRVRRIGGLVEVVA